MLNKHSKKMLKFLRESRSKFQDHIIPRDYIVKEYLDKDDSGDATLDYLAEDGYIRKLYLGGVLYAFSLTESGLHYPEFTATSIKSFVLRSIVTPIIVSAITSLITLWLSGL